MKCTRVKKLLNRYADRELVDKKTTILIEEHLHRCSSCKAELDSIISIKEIISQKEKLTVSKYFLAKLKAKLKKSPQAIEITWVKEMGNLARRLVLVPAVLMILFIVLIPGGEKGLNPVDDYILGSLNNQEIAILTGYIDNSDLLAEMMSIKIKEG